MLDTGSTIKATIKNEDFLSGICISKKPIIIATNADVKIMRLEGDLTSFGVAPYEQRRTTGEYLRIFSHGK